MWKGEEGGQAEWKVENGYMEVARGMESLERIGTSPSTTYVLPQETTSLLSRYGRHLTGNDIGEGRQLDSLDFDAETRELLGLDDIEELAAGDGNAEADFATETADIERDAADE
jgi:hypothetical protein